MESNTVNMEASNKQQNNRGMNGTKLHSKDAKLSSESVPLKRTSVVEIVAVTTPDENDARGTWSGKLDFILSCISYAVGLGNVWRFPFLCYENGGGAFLIPYVIILCLAGLPLFFLELSIGQFASVGCVNVWRICPLFKGMGYGMLVMSMFCCIYYNVIIAYTLHYLYFSFTRVLPWADCTHNWNTYNCVDSRHNVTNFTSGHSRPSQEYFDNRVLGISDGIGEIGEIRWELAICLVLAWTIVFLSLAKGIKTSGKVVYLTATFPYLVLLSLFIRGMTLPGAIDGVKFYIKPEWSKLKTSKVWQDAAVQIFYSLGAGFGCLHTLSSYNKWHNNCHRDAIIVAIVNCGTSIFAGFVIFAVIGFMAYDAGVDVETVVVSGPGLAFVAYPEAIARMPISPMWSILFFFMVLLLGLGSMLCMLETVITGIVDDLEARFKNIRKYKSYITLATSILLCILGLPLITQGGIYLLTLMNAFSAGLTLLLFGFMECIIIAYIYGVERYLHDITAMLGFRPSFYWKICWMVVAPSLLMFVIIFTFVSYNPAKYGEDYVFPAWAEALGWLMTASSILPVIIYAAIYLFQEKGPVMERLKNSMKHKSLWGPALAQHRKEAGYHILEQEEAENRLNACADDSYSSSMNSNDDPELALNLKSHYERTQIDGKEDQGDVGASFLTDDIHARYKPKERLYPDIESAL
ncbi:sodium- and chloride-dependent glycine transporter 1-like [Antedon mediterranea]|uniref:sodium- and chloride-dependent glycine transporter 1-like n=1 Tax=Antedon mediterranea TaxID=105859 RepID=UPI003AF68153